MLLVPREDDEFASVGTVAEVVEHMRLPGGGRAVALAGLHRGIAGAAHTDPSGVLRVEVTPHPDDEPVDGKTRNLEREYRALVEEILELRGDDGRISAFLRSISEPGALADTSGYSPDIGYSDKVDLLETLDVTERLEKAVKLQRDRLTELQVRSQIRDDVQSGADKQQREYFLRKQMESIRKELGDDDASVAEEYRKKVEASGMPEAVREQADKEIDRLERMGEQSGESSMIRTYLDWLVSVPWSEHLRRGAGPGEGPRGARRRPRRTRGREGQDRGAHRRDEAAPRPRPGRHRRPEVRRHPHPDRPSRHRQDLDRRIDRSCHGARVRAHVAGRRARRGRDPRAPQDLHRRPPGPPGARPA